MILDDYPLAAVLVTPPAEPVISLAEAKAHLRVEHPDDDDVISGLIQAATDHLDGWNGVLGRALVTQTWRVDLPYWRYPIRLPIEPVQSIDSVEYWDTTNATATVAGGDYALYSDSIGPHVSLVGSASWPSVYSRPDAIRITFVAGYGAAADVPEPIRLAAKMLVGHWFDNREAVRVGSPAAPLPMAVDALIAPFRRWWKP